MHFAIRYAERALRDLRQLDHGIAQRIVSKVRQYRLSENPLIYAHRLTGAHRGLYRFRIGDYRIVFTANKEGNLVILLILRIAHRREVYR